MVRTILAGSPIIDVHVELLKAFAKFIFTLTKDTYTGNVLITWPIANVARIYYSYTEGFQTDFHATMVFLNLKIFKFFLAKTSKYSNSIYSLMIVYLRID